jgi:hypothetical protein
MSRWADEFEPHLKYRFHRTREICTGRWNMWTWRDIVNPLQVTQSLGSSGSAVIRLQGGWFDSQQSGRKGRVQTCSGAHLASCTTDTGLKRPGREADLLPPCNAEVKNVCSYTSTLQYVFMLWYLVKHQELHLHLCKCMKRLRMK